MSMKAVWFVVMAILIGSIAGYLFFSSENNEPKEKVQVAQLSENTPAETAQVKNSVVASLRQAMNVGTPFQCKYGLDAEMETVTSQMYVAGKKFRAEAETSGVKTQVLFDGETQYIWTSGSTQGMKMSQSCLENLKSTLSEKSPAEKVMPQDYQQTFDQAQNVKCEPVETDMTLIFSVPNEITFTDQCAMMEQSKKMMEQVKGMMPTPHPGQ